jgi:hypothetical protein
MTGQPGFRYGNLASVNQVTQEFFWRWRKKSSGNLFPGYFGHNLIGTYNIALLILVNTGHPIPDQRWRQIQKCRCANPADAML